MMMWLFDGKVNQVSKDQVMLLHIDGFLARQKYHDDKMNLFFETYYRNFKGIITANSLKNATLCVENLIFQPIGIHFTHQLTYQLTCQLTHSFIFSAKIFCMGLVDN
jgi:hypothetical protein